MVYCDGDGVEAWLEVTNVEVGDIARYVTDYSGGGGRERYEGVINGYII